MPNVNPEFSEIITMSVVQLPSYGLTEKKRLHTKIILTQGATALFFFSGV